MRKTPTKGVVIFHARSGEVCLLNILKQQATVELAVGLEIIEKLGFINPNNLVFNCRISRGSTSNL